MNFRAFHLLSAVGLHGLLFVLLATSVRCTPEMRTPVAIQGVLLDPNREQVARLQRAQEEKKRAAEQERVQREQEIETARARVEEQRKQAELKKVEEESLRKKKELENHKKKEKEQQAKKELDKDRKAKEEQQHKKQEQQKTLEKNEQALRNRQLEADAAAVEQAQGERLAKAAVDQWGAQVKALVTRNWLRPPDVNEKFECIVQIEQLPSGQIMNRAIVQSCGNRLLDDSVLKAVDKSNPLPLAGAPAPFTPRFTFKFCPNCD